MATMEQCLEQLQQDRETLSHNLELKDVRVDINEPFTSLVAKVALLDLGRATLAEQTEAVDLIRHLTNEHNSYDPNDYTPEVIEEIRILLRLLEGDDLDGE